MRFAKPLRLAALALALMGSAVQADPSGGGSPGCVGCQILSTILADGGSPGCGDCRIKSDPLAGLLERPGGGCLDCVISVAPLIGT